MLKSSELTTWSNGGSAKSQELRKGYTNLTNDEQKKKKKRKYSTASKSCALCWKKKFLNYTKYDLKISFGSVGKLKMSSNAKNRGDLKRWGEVDIRSDGEVKGWINSIFDIFVMQDYWSEPKSDSSSYTPTNWQIDMN